MFVDEGDSLVAGRALYSRSRHCRPFLWSGSSVAGRRYWRALFLPCGVLVMCALRASSIRNKSRRVGALACGKPAVAAAERDSQPSQAAVPTAAMSCARAPWSPALQITSGEQFQSRGCPQPTSTVAIDLIRSRSAIE